MLQLKKKKVGIGNKNERKYTKILSVNPLRI